MAKQSSQKFIARNRAPRVQIEYDVELYGAEKKVQLPFVMGVMADLAGKPAEPLAPVADRKFLEIDVDNFDSRLKAMQPRVAFHVPNELTGEGNLSLDLTFESMDDFSPAGRLAEQAARSAHPTGQPADLHGRQDWRRRNHHESDQGPCPVAGPGQRAQARRQRAQGLIRTNDHERIST